MITVNPFSHKICLSLSMRKKLQMLTEDPSMNNFVIVANSVHIQKSRKETQRVSSCYSIHIILMILQTW